MTDPIKPALTPDAWMRALSPSFGDDGVNHMDLGERLSYAREEVGLDVSNHGLAALALYGQPFGFTAEDVDLLLHAASLIEGEWGDEITERDLRNLADRIAALQPPREA